MASIKIFDVDNQKIVLVMSFETDMEMYKQWANFKKNMKSLSFEQEVWAEENAGYSDYFVVNRR